MVFPDLPLDSAVEALWDAVLKACRIDGGDTVADWDAHLDHLDARKAYLNQRGYSAIRYQGPGTDLTVGLNPAHFWNHPGEGNGERRTVANIPTEEVSTSPDSRLADGVGALGDEEGDAAVAEVAEPRRLGDRVDDVGEP